jgi:ribonuclease P protein component
MVLFVAPGLGGIGVVAGRKVGGAVERNRARRVIRAASRELTSRIDADVDVVWVARASIEGAKTQELLPEMSELLRSAGAVR